MIIAQLSDPHIFEPGRSMEGRVDTAAQLVAALHAVAELGDMVAAVVLSGDLVNDGLGEQYDHLGELLGTAIAAGVGPFLPVVGNHDDREHFRALFAPLVPEIGGRADDPVHYVVDRFVAAGGPRIVVLDTTVPGRHDGYLDDGDVSWLNRTLGDAPHTPTVVVQHHPAFMSGVGFMDQYGLRGASHEARVLEGHRQVRAVWSGHLHRHCVSTVGGVVAVGAPSTAAQVWLDLANGGTAYSSEPGAHMLHHVGCDPYVSHVVSESAGERWVPSWARE